MLHELIKEDIVKLITNGTLGFVKNEKLGGCYADQVYTSSWVEKDKDAFVIRIYTDSECPVVFSDKLAEQIISKYPELELQIVTVSQMRQKKDGNLCLISSGGLCIDKNGNIPVLVKDPCAPSGAAGCSTNSMGRNEMFSIQENGRKEAVEEMTLIGIPANKGIQQVVHFNNLDFSRLSDKLDTVEHFYKTNDGWKLEYSYKAFVLHDENCNTFEIAEIGYFDGVFTQVFDNEPFGRIGYPIHTKTLEAMKSVPVLKAAVLFLLEVGEL